ncbi:ABC transporter substrate-binding protein [Enorma burkinafasonensis]|uniref:ABC transporter substrate-binding protein n=1 Tax=Enorma burkinafasonensis TaxID=2590867 RepID=UPI0026ED59CC|nr:ABC transporter substrate-binding protein [Enorma burkinafasonensis]MCI7730671.1 ABC transporter substrate-binding protein [Enorma burkinafasonensis]
MNTPVLTRRGLIASLALAGALPLTACGGTSSEGGSAAGSAPAAGSYKIGVLQLTQHAALDQTNEGFIAALDESGIAYDADQQNASNDQNACQTIAQTFVNGGCDLIFAIGTPAAQAVASATAEIPIVGSAITDFESVGLVATNDAPGGNVTGSSDLTPVADQIELLQQLVPDVATVGLLYCTAESNSTVQIDLAKEALDGAGIAYEEYTVSSSNEIQSVVETMVGQVDAVYAPTDNTIAAAMAQVSSIADEAGVPVIVGCDTMVEDGGTASYSINYFDLGHRAGEMAVRILTEGADPAEMPIEYLDASECTLIANQGSADACGIDLSVLDGPEIV